MPLATSPALDAEPNADRFEQQVLALSTDSAILLLDAQTLAILAHVGGNDGDGTVLDRETLNALLDGGKRTTDGNGGGKQWIGTDRRRKACRRRRPKCEATASCNHGEPKT